MSKSGGSKFNMPNWAITGSTITLIGGDQHSYGVKLDELAAFLRRLNSSIEGDTALPPEIRSQASNMVKEVAEEISKPSPDHRSIREKLEALGGTLSAIKGVATNALDVATSVAAIGTWVTALFSVAR